MPIVESAQHPWFRRMQICTFHTIRPRCEPSFYVQTQRLPMVTRCSDVRTRKKYSSDISTNSSNFQSETTSIDPSGEAESGRSYDKIISLRMTFKIFPKNMLSFPHTRCGVYTTIANEGERARHRANEIEETVDTTISHFVDAISTTRRQ